ncbi:hypothetical protein QBC39DRAFT_388377 [Podospora conica]|nr:hypothetical protein QBC39DRAFT_388377 [Schizothecium conicum]
MCYYYYGHHHHLPPCTRDIDIAVYYSFCRAATVDAAGTQQPCSYLQYDDTQIIDYQDPCATGGCMPSPECETGGCRLLQLNGRWKCCQCRRGGNEGRMCRHPMRGSPDTFCYHNCCPNCQADKRR